jgi:FdhD protein
VPNEEKGHGVERLHPGCAGEPQPVMRLVPGVRLATAMPPRDADCAVPEETAIAFCYNGFPHAVTMATPADLEDLAVGFSMTEAITRAANDIRQIAIRATADGIALDIAIAAASFERFLRQRRQRSMSGRTSCGLCGVEDFADVHQPVRRVAAGLPLAPEAVRRALNSLRDFQPLARETGATHAAAWAACNGEIRLVREDVGRHNALDKLIGACLRKHVDLSAGFCVVTSRCSFEMVQKAVAAGMPALVAISAPTALAVRLAEQSGLCLIALARSDNQIIYSGANRVLAEEPA